MVVRISKYLAIVIRKQAMAELTIEREKLFSTLEVDGAFDEDDELLSIGPLWPESVNEFVKRLKNIGLSHVDDFFEIDFDVPEWMQLHCSISSEQGN